MAGLLSKILGGEKKTDLDSCCGAVRVTAEDETTENNDASQAEATSAEPKDRAAR
ncbi:hypothetical protein IQ279_26605 [Streptomyces verrucosisporus]|uniref:hypothetical protein n=1 Tax=Streptomyces verrucosisporus TaxID=1695161 RepID=UPI0019D0F10E|nr:hypothetical protein [Streptomyces verrucosisporus]MBN3933132.1 hypothetical protein [Streptomyces verrucosisporus]